MCLDTPPYDLQKQSTLYVAEVFLAFWVFHLFVFLFVFFVSFGFKIEV